MRKVISKFLCFGGSEHETPSRVVPIDGQLRPIRSRHQSRSMASVTTPHETEEVLKEQEGQKVTTIQNAITEGEVPEQKVFVSTIGTETTQTNSLTASKTHSKVEVFFQDTNNAIKAPKLIVQDSQIDEKVNKIKSKSGKQRRELELKFIDAYQNGKSRTMYGIADEWIDNYEKYLNGQTKIPPGPINNLGLKEKLKAEQSSQDTYLVNELVWRFFVKLYGAAPEVVINNAPKSMKGSMVEGFINGSQGPTSLNETLKKFEEEIQETLKNLNEPIGMLNPGYYCYMNSCLQYLLGVKQLVDYVAEEKYKTLRDSEKNKFWPAIAEVIDASICKKNNYAAESIKNLSIEKFNPSQQQDAHEFLNFILAGMQTEANLPQPNSNMVHKDSQSAWNHYKKYHTSIIDELFAGQLVSRVTCSKCKNSTTKYESFLDLSLPIISAGKVTLNDCLAAFQRGGEVIESYRCHICRALRKATKKLQVSIFPNILTIHLKRFNPKREKITTPVEFPIDKWEINIAEDSQRESFDYSLKAAICHSGSIDSGHYVCYSKRDQEWFKCNDDKITKASPEEILNEETYLLIYERK